MAALHYTTLLPFDWRASIFRSFASEPLLLLLLLLIFLPLLQQPSIAQARFIGFERHLCGRRRGKETVCSSSYALLLLSMQMLQLEFVVRTLKLVRLSAELTVMFFFGCLFNFLQYT